MIEIPLNRSSHKPLYRQISEHLSRMISTGTLPEEGKLPSSRDMARSLGVSRMTVVEAYRVLEVDGFIEQRGRSGAYVHCNVDKKDLLEGGAVPRWDMRTDRPSAEFVPTADLARISREVLLLRGKEMLREEYPAGHRGLRRLLVHHAASRGIPARWEDVVVTSGGRQGISLAIAALWQAGVRRIWMDSLTYPDAIDMAQAEGMGICILPSGSDGMLDIVGAVAPGEALYLVPSFSNPTGRTMSVAARQLILEASRKRGIWIVEDDAYGELRYCDISVPALKAMNGSERVLYLGSFSQALFPGLRVGYSLIPEELKSLFLSILAIRSGPISSLVQQITAAFIKSGGLEMSLSSVRSEMAARMRLLCESLEKVLPQCCFSRPMGGIYLWLETPGLSGILAAELALAEGVALVPGRIFSVSGDDVEAVRLSVSSIPISEIEDVVLALGRAWREYLECGGSCL